MTGGFCSPVLSGVLSSRRPGEAQGRPESSSGSLGTWPGRTERARGPSGRRENRAVSVSVSESRARHGSDRRPQWPLMCGSKRPRRLSRPGRRSGLHAGLEADTVRFSSAGEAVRAAPDAGSPARRLVSSGTRVSSATMSRDRRVESRVESSLRAPRCQPALAGRGRIGRVTSIFRSALGQGQLVTRMTDSVGEEKPHHLL